MFALGFIIAGCFIAKPTMIAWRAWQKQENSLPILKSIEQINACTDAYTQIDLALVERTMREGTFKLKTVAVMMFFCEMTIPGIPIVILLAAAVQGFTLKRVLDNWKAFFPELKAYLKLIK